MAFMNADSPLGRFVSRLGQVVLLNVVFVASLLPVITAGASLSALAGTSMRWVRGETETPAEDFVAAYRANFRQAVPLGLLVAVAGAALVAWAVVLPGLALGALAQFLAWGVWFLLVSRLCLVLVYLFGYQATFDDPLGVIVRNCRLMSIKHLPQSLLMAAITVLPVLVTVFYPRYVLFGLVWLAVGFAGVACANGVVLNQVFGHYGVRPAHPAATQPATGGVTEPLGRPSPREH